MSSTKPWRMFALVLGFALASGLMEERLLKTVWGPKGRRFRQAWLMSCTSFLATSAFAFIAALRSPSASGPSSLRPSQPLYRYLLVGVMLAGSSTCAHRALMHVSFTTVSLAPLSELFVTSLFLHLVAEREYSTRRWTSIWIVFVATAVYLFSLNLPRNRQNSLAQTEIEEWGMAYLILSRALLGFAGWAERKWLPGAEEPALRQLAWTRLLGAAGAGVMVWNQVRGPIKMDLITTPYFAPEWPRWDLALFALVSGLATVLYTTTTAHSADSYSHPAAAETLPVPEPLLEPVLLFAQVVVNAVAFKRVGRVPAKAWTAAGWVFGGWWIKCDPRFDDSDESAPKGTTLGTFNAQGKYVRVPSVSISKQPGGKEDAELGAGVGAGEGGNLFWRQYAPALLLPPLVVIFLRGLLTSAAGVQHVPALGTFVNGSKGVVLLEGGNWELEFHQAITPVCLDGNATRRWPGARRTVLASHERSGNTWTRELVERSTGWQSSTISYCDKALLRTFQGECDHEANFLVKTHFPRMPADDSIPWRDYIDGHHINQAVHLVRNPIDSIYSEWQLAHALRKNGELDHSSHTDIGLLGGPGRNGKEQQKEVMRAAANWARHEQFWAHKSEIPTHRVRYEDLMRYKLPSLMGLLSFLLPPDELPSLSNLACITEMDAGREAYKSRKSPAFAAWDKWDKHLRIEVIKAVKTGWCRHGYDQLLDETMQGAGATGVEDICSH